MQTSKEDKRRGLLAKIHIAKKQLGLSDQDYRTIVAVETEAESCKDLSLEDLESVLDRMRRLGFVEVSRRDPKRLLSRQKTLLRFLWLQLAEAGAVEDGGDKALDVWIRGRFGVDKLQWLTVGQAQSGIEQLKAWKRRIEGGAV